MYIDRFDEVLAAVIEVVYPSGPAGDSLRVFTARQPRAAGRSPAPHRSEETLLSPDGAGRAAHPAEDDRHVGRPPRRSRARATSCPTFAATISSVIAATATSGRTAPSRKSMPRCRGSASRPPCPTCSGLAEMFRRNGTLDGARVLAGHPRAGLSQLDRRQAERALPTVAYREKAGAPFPAYIGLGFSLRGTALGHPMYGTLTSPEHLR